MSEEKVKLKDVNVKVHIQNSSLKIDKTFTVASDAKDMKKIKENLFNNIFFELEDREFILKINPFSTDFKVPDRVINGNHVNLKKRPSSLPYYRGSSRVNFADKRSHSKKRVIIILESPHTNEFKIDNEAYSSQEDKYKLTKEIFTPIRAANGATGKSVENLFEIIRNTMDSGDCVLINKIPYQASLGSFLNEEKVCKTLKKAILKKMWEEESVKKDFMNRLKKHLNGYSNKNILIINASTKDADTKNDVFQDFLEKQSILSGVKILMYNHPSLWKIQKISNK